VIKLIKVITKDYDFTIVFPVFTWWLVSFVTLKKKQVQRKQKITQNKYYMKENPFYEMLLDQLAGLNIIQLAAIPYLL
jgi:hypothetical protein